MSILPPIIMFRIHRQAALFTLVGLLVAFALRVHLLGSQDVWWDEGLAVWAARQPFAHTTLWTAGDVHPPLYFWLLWPWLRLGGDSPFAMRFLTLAFGLLSAAIGCAVARRLSGAWDGALAVWLIGLSRFEVWWSQEMRMYMLAGMLGLLALYATLRLMAGFSWRNALLYIAAAAGAMYTVYLSAFYLLILSLLVSAAALARWLAGRRRSAIQLTASWLVANLIVVALLVPWLLLAASRMNSWSVAAPVPLGLPFTLYGVLLATGASTDIDQYGWAAAAVGLVCAIGAVASAGIGVSRRTSRLPRWQTILLLLLVLLLPPSIIYALTQPGRLFYVPRLEARYFLPFAAAFYALLAWALAGLWRRWRVIGAAGIVIVLSIFVIDLPDYYTGRHLSDGYPSAVRAIRAHAQPGDVVALVSGGRYPLFLYEYDRAGLGGYRASVLQVPQHNPALTPNNIDVELEPLLRDYRRVWLMLADPHMEDPEALALPWLQARRTTLFDQRFNTRRLVLLAGEAQVLSVPHAAPQYWVGGNGSYTYTYTTARLIGYDLPVPRIVPGESAYLAPYWRLGREQTVVYTWQHESGRQIAVVTQTLAPAAAGDIRHIIELPVYGATPAGAYTLSARLEDGSVEDLPGPQVIGTRPLPPSGLCVEQPARVGGFEFIGFAVDPLAATVRRGQSLMLYLDWQIDRRVNERITFFAHLLGAAFNPATNGPVWAGHDSEPLDGGLPTTQWWTGQVIRDPISLAIPDEAPPGEYQIEIGAYPAGNPQRLDVSGEGADAANRRVLLKVIVNVE